MRLALLANLGGALGALGGNFALVRGEHELVGRRAPAQLLERRRQRIQPRLELGEPPFERYVLGGCAPLARLDGRLQLRLGVCLGSLGARVRLGCVRVCLCCAPLRLGARHLRRLHLLQRAALQARERSGKCVEARGVHVEALRNQREHGLKRWGGGLRVEPTGAVWRPHCEVLEGDSGHSSSKVVS